MMHRLLLALPPEPAHRLSLKALQWGLAGRAPQPDPRLAVRLWGQTFPSPLGLAAGFDKQGQVMAPLLKLGLGFVEVGTITPAPQPGNPGPRVFRAPAQRAVINRYGFNSQGHACVQARLSAFRAAHPEAALGINLGMNKATARPLDAYKKGVELFEDLATYLVINLSSPNTQGLRDQQTQGLGELIDGLQAARRHATPLLLKVAPDLGRDQIALIAETARAKRLDGLIVANTTLDRPATLPPAFAARAGGLSGAPLRDKALAALAAFYGYLQGDVPLIAVGGLMSGRDAVTRLRAGADLLQCYTGLIYRGPKLIQEINQAILQAMQHAGLDSPAALKGTVA